MRSVGFVVHEGRTAAVEAAATLRDLLDGEGIECGDAAAAGVDLVVAVGGDGTFLRGAHAAARLGVPVLGVKVGRLGFLTEVEPDDAASLIVHALAGDAPVEDRLAVVGEPVNGPGFEPQWGMNEIMIEKRARHRLVRLRVEVDGEYLTTFSADGVIVATPTGSTAYNLAAGGPIVQPVVDAIVLTPIAPHMLTNRPIVIPASSIVRVQPMMNERDEIYVTFDGQAGHQLEQGDEVRIRCAERRVRLLRPSSRSYFEVLRQKLKWNER